MSRSRVRLRIPTPPEFNDGAALVHYEEDVEDVVRIQLTKTNERGYDVVGGMYTLGRDIRRVAHARGMIQIDTTTGEFTFYAGDAAHLIYADICRRMQDGASLR